MRLRHIDPMILASRVELNCNSLKVSKIYLQKYLLTLSFWYSSKSRTAWSSFAKILLFFTFTNNKKTPPLLSFQFLPLDVAGKTQKFQDIFESYLFGRFWGRMYTHDIRTIWKLIIINVPIVISWTFLVTPHNFRVLITIEQGIAVQSIWWGRKALIETFSFHSIGAQYCEGLGAWAPLKCQPI